MQKYIHTTWRLWKLLKPFHKYFYLQLFFVVIIQMFSILNTYFISKIIDSSIMKDINLISKYLVIYFLSIIIIRIFSFLSDREEIKKSYGTIQQYLEEYSLANIFKLNPSQYTENHSAIKQRVVDQGENAVQSIVETLILQLLPLVLVLLFSVVAVSKYSLVLGSVVSFTILLIIIATYKFTNYWRPMMRKNIDNWNDQSKIKVEAFEHLYTIKVMGINLKYMNKYLEKRLSIVSYHVNVWMLNTNFRNIRDVFISISEYACLAISLYLFMNDQITVGIIYALFSWVSKAYGQLGNVNNILRRTPTNYIYLEQYLNLIDTKPDFSENGKHKFTDGDIVFNNLSFKYPKGESNVLDNINITIPRGKKIAFVGASGSGKTTITRLLLRAYDYNEGEILINSVNIKDLDAHSLRRSIGYVEQHVDLFDDTIKNNILFGVDEKVLSKWNKDNITDNRLEEISKLARIDEFYHRLGESKFNTEIGERGIKLSGGERQRIGIARAIIKDPAILIFDEATSALDTVNEKYIKEAIDNVSKGRTTIIIAHRLSTIIDSDIIFVMDKGKLVAQGTHDELSQSSRHYQELIKHQEL